MSIVPQPPHWVGCEQRSEYLDCLGAVLAETGEQDEAVKVLQKAASLQPDRGFAKYMYATRLLACSAAHQGTRNYHPLMVYAIGKSHAPGLGRYLGQLLEAEQAHAAMQKGIDVLQSAIDKKAPWPTLPVAPAEPDHRSVIVRSLYMVLVNAA